MSRFYITLPSNSSMDYYPENTVAQYTTKLNNPIELDGEWEVGLTEISFPYEIENILEGECYFYMSNTDHDNPVKVLLPATHVKRIEDLFAHLRAAQMLITSSEPRVPIEFAYHKNQNRVRMRCPANTTVKFSPALARLLGFRHGVTYSELSVLGEYRMRFRSTIRSVYVYCDLVEHVVVGDTKAPLLRIVNRSQCEEDKVHRTFNPPLYIPLQKKCFDSVEINMMTDFGIPVPFRLGKSFVVLEFRRAIYKYFAM